MSGSCRAGLSVKFLFTIEVDDGAGWGERRMGCARVECWVLLSTGCGDALVRACRPAWGAACRNSLQKGPEGQAGALLPELARITSELRAASDPSAALIPISAAVAAASACPPAPACCMREMHAKKTDARSPSGMLARQIRRDPVDPQCESRSRGDHMVVHRPNNAVRGAAIKKMIEIVAERHTV